VGDARAEEPELDASFQASPGRIVPPAVRALDVELDGEIAGTSETGGRDPRDARVLQDVVADLLAPRLLVRSGIAPACGRAVLVDVEAAAAELCLELVLDVALEELAELARVAVEASPLEGEHLVAALHPALEHYPDVAVKDWRPRVRDAGGHLGFVACHGG